jgi:hypothetical protein
MAGIIKGSDLEIKKESFELHQRLKPILGEYMDDWMLVGRRATGGKVLVSYNSGGWKDMQQLYEYAVKWKKENTLADTS